MLRSARGPPGRSDSFWAAETRMIAHAALRCGDRHFPVHRKVRRRPVRFATGLFSQAKSLWQGSGIAAYWRIEFVDIVPELDPTGLIDPSRPVDEVRGNRLRQTHGLRFTDPHRV